MAIVCQINIYDVTYDRGVNMGKTLWRHYDINEEEIVVGQVLPHWSDRNDGPVVVSYDRGHIELDYRKELYSIKVGDEVMLSEGISIEPEAAMWGIETIIQHCVKLLE